MAADGERPVQLIVSDDLARERVSVFFRILLALPHLIWALVWTIGAFFAAIANWVIVIVRGSSPLALHNFLAAYVRYVTHVYAYLYLAAQPFPDFLGRPGYPVDVQIASPQRQSRAGAAVRILLVLPALILSSVLLGSTFSTYSGRRGSTYRPLGLVAAASFLGWFASVVKGRMPRGLRDAIAFGLSYGAQAWAYLLLLTDRYPSSDPLTAIGPLPSRSDPVRIVVTDDLRRSRLTVFFRVLLALPHLVWLVLWSVLAYIAAVLNWVATLVAGRSPDGLHRFLSAYVRYDVHVYGFLLLVANPFPGFTGRQGSYPLDLRVASRAVQNRWSVLFRIFLAIPAFLMAGAYGSALYVAAIFGWFASLVTGRMPLGLRNLGALALRYNAQMYAYVFLLTGSYPYAGPTTDDMPADGVPPGPLGSPTAHLAFGDPQPSSGGGITAPPGTQSYNS